MYLNIINNINIEKNRKNKEFFNEKEENADDEKDIEENNFNAQINLKSYYSIFYGELTNNWIHLRP
tara:strand:- start:366 stop:563 length:198 start_codon:yes stop_codon:yes gene_type:complete